MDPKILYVLQCPSFTLFYIVKNDDMRNITLETLYQFYLSALSTKRNNNRNNSRRKIEDDERRIIFPM